MSGDVPYPITVLNDRLRREGVGGRIKISRGIFDLPGAMIARILREVRDFDAFDEDNDPYGEHDCATLIVSRHTVMFQIAYYDLSLRHRSPDPADPARTIRVMTVMLVEEY